MAKVFISKFLVGCILNSFLIRIKVEVLIENNIIKLNYKILFIILVTFCKYLLIYFYAYNLFNKINYSIRKNY